MTVSVKKQRNNMKIECQSQGIYLKPENYQDGLYLASQYLDLIDEYGIDGTPSNMELWCSKEKCGGDITSLFNLKGEEKTEAYGIADHVKWMFIGRGSL